MLFFKRWTKMKIYLTLMLILNVSENALAINHWIVTETGKIQTYLESPFDLRRPYDLLALLDQETRRVDVNELYDDLISRKSALERKWIEIEKNTNVGFKISSQDIDCLESANSVIDIYKTIASNGTERGIVIKLPKKEELPVEAVPPLCNNFNKVKRISTLVNKTNLVFPTDDFLKKNFIPVKSVSHFGNYVSSVLSKNATSWVHYNLASFYWRVKGDGDKAIDCLKLAIQFVTENYRDIPLFNLAGILHHARLSREAAQILQSAIEIAPKESMHYLAIANIYASLKDYEKSVQYYERFLEFNPAHKEAAVSRHAVLCYFKLDTALTNVQTDLQNVLNDLHEYHSLQQQWLRLQERLIWEHSSFNYHYDGTPTEDHQTDRIKKVQRCIQKISDGSTKPIISCDFSETGPNLASLNLQNLYQFVENEKQKLNGQLQNAFGDVMFKKRDTEPMFSKFPTSLSMKGNQYFDATGWPTKEDCLQWNVALNDKEDLNLPLFLPPENKGHNVKKILSQYIDLSEGSQQELPWYPPVCEGDNVNGEKFVPINDKNIIDNDIKSNDFLKKHFLKYVNDGRVDEAEIGQRIITAMEKKAAPKWVLATLASLYWRIRSNTRKALDCLDMAFQMVPKDQTDVVLVSLASTVHQLGLREQAMKFATLAFKINYIEPSTNFMLSLLHYENNNPLLATYYMKNVVRVDAEFYDGLALTLLKTWACRIKLGTGLSLKPKQPSDEMCSNLEAIKSEDVTHAKIQNLCKGAAVYCYKKATPEGDHPTLNGCNLNFENINVISSMMPPEGSGDSGDTYTEHSIFVPRHIHHVHMRLALGEKHPVKEFSALNEFLVSVALGDHTESEISIHVYDRFGTYTLSHTTCKNLDVLEPFKYASIWPSIVSRTIDITSFLKSTSAKDVKPHCTQAGNLPMPHGLDALTQRVLKDKVPNFTDKTLSELLALMAGNQKISLKDLGARIGNALKEDETSWALLTASAIYWMTVGNSEHALICLRAAISQVPENALDIPLVYLAHLLNSVRLHKEALTVASIALKMYPNFILNHFMVGNIYTSSGDYEKAVVFMRACLSLDSNFEPARTRIKALLCKVLFDDANNPAANVARQIVDGFD